MSTLNLQAIRKQARDALNNDHLVTIHPTELLDLLDHTRELEAAEQRVRDLSDEMSEGKASCILTMGKEPDYPVSYFIEHLEKALEGDQS